MVSTVMLGVLFVATLMKFCVVGVPCVNAAGTCSVIDLVTHGCITDNSTHCIAGKYTRNLLRQAASRPRSA